MASMSDKILGELWQNATDQLLHETSRKRARLLIHKLIEERAFHYQEAAGFGYGYGPETQFINMALHDFYISKEEFNDSDAF